MLPPVDPNPGKIETIPRGFCTKYTRKLDRAVALIYDSIKEEARRLYEPPQVPRLLQKLKKAIFRPPTPSVKGYPQEEEMIDQAVVFIQKMLRGRFVQVQLLEGRFRRQDLIDELRSVYTLLKTEKYMKELDKQKVLDTQFKEETNQYMKNNLNEFVSHAEGAAIANLLDFLSKELIRLQEERCVHAFVMLAERQRYLREAEEGGRRQLEERRRAEEDEIFKHVVKVHQITVDSYLEDIIIATNEQVADDQTRKEIQKMAEEINNVAYEIENYRTQLDSEEIVADLVHSFLLPEVLKSSAREKVYLHQRKHLLAARELIYGPDSKRKDLFDRTADEAEVLRQSLQLERQALKALKWNHPIVPAKACLNIAQDTPTPSGIKIYSKQYRRKKSLSKEEIYPSSPEAGVKKILSTDETAELRADVVESFQVLHKLTLAAKEEQRAQEFAASTVANVVEPFEDSIDTFSVIDDMLTTEVDSVIEPLESKDDVRVTDGALTTDEDSVMEPFESTDVPVTDEMLTTDESVIKPLESKDNVEMFKTAIDSVIKPLEKLKDDLPVSDEMLTASVESTIESLDEDTESL